MNDTQKKALLILGGVLLVAVLFFSRGKTSTNPAAHPSEAGNYDRLDRIIERSDSVLNR